MKYCWWKEASMHSWGSWGARNGIVFHGYAIVNHLSGQPGWKPYVAKHLTNPLGAQIDGRNLMALILAFSPPERNAC